MSIKAQNGMVVDYQYGLCELVCPTCHQEIEWNTENDVDGIIYTHSCCGKDYIMKPHVMRIIIVDQEE